MTTDVGAIDQGTTSTRFMVFDHTGAVAAIAREESEQIYPRPGWVEHDPAEAGHPHRPDDLEINRAEGSRCSTPARYLRPASARRGRSTRGPAPGRSSVTRPPARGGRTRAT